METISDPYRRHLFDNDSMFNVYKEETTNLSVGAPGPDLLQYCVEMMKEATDHRLVKIYNFITIRVNLLLMILMVILKEYFILGKRKERRKILFVSIWHHSRFMGMS